VRRLAIALVAAAAGASTLESRPAQTPDQQRPVFRAGIARVRIDALVTHDNRPVTGLAAGDFELKDNGVVQTIEMSTTAGSVAVAIALDVSGSIEDDGLEDLLHASEALADALEPDDQAWLVTFNDEFRLRAGPVTDPAPIKRALDRVRAGGGTSMWDALFASVSLVAGTAGRSLVILFTDGADSTSWLDEKRAVEALSRADVVVETVRPRTAAFGLAPLEAVARAPGGAVRAAERQERMAQQFVNLLREFRLSYVLTYVPTGVALDGWHDVEVRLKNKRGRVRAKSGYYVK
jgi:VWFA-related protein